MAAAGGENRYLIVNSLFLREKRIESKIGMLTITIQVCLPKILWKGTGKFFVC